MDVLILPTPTSLVLETADRRRRRQRSRSDQALLQLPNTGWFRNSDKSEYLISCPNQRDGRILCSARRRGYSRAASTHRVPARTRYAAGNNRNGTRLSRPDLRQPQPEAFRMNSEQLFSFKLKQIVGARDVLAQNSTPAITRHSVDHAAQLFDVIARMIGMRVIGGPEEAVLGNDLGQRRD